MAEELIGLAAEAGVGAVKPDQQPPHRVDGVAGRPQRAGPDRDLRRDPPYGCAGRRLDRCPGDQMINLRRVGRYLDRSAAGIERRCRRRRR